MTLTEYRRQLLSRGVELKPVWINCPGDLPFTMHGHRAHEVETDKYLGLVIVQDMGDGHLITYTETPGLDTDADALAILGMKE